MSESDIEVGNYVLLQTIGSGGFSKVKLAEDKTTKQRYAIKIIKKSKLEDKPDLKIKIQREIALMKLFDHPHLIKLIEICESTKYIFIVLEYAQNGELFDYLIARRSLPLEEAMRLFRQIIYGVDFLHNNSICHRDLKPENILLDDHNNVKIADFGFARWLKQSTTQTSCGSPHYAAPEVVKGIPYNGKKADIWSCGVILYALLAGRLPFNEPSMRELLAKIKNGIYRMPDFQPDIKDLVSRMLTVDPEKRITIEQIKHHRAFKLDLPRKYTVPTPLPRPTKIDPININEVDPQVVSILYNIGFEEDKLPEMLSEKEFNEAKYFCVLLTQQISLQSLPWTDMDAENSILASDTTDSSASTPAHIPQQDDNPLFYVDDGVPISGGYLMNGKDPFARKNENEVANSMVVYSLIEKTEYFSPLIPKPEQKVEVINGISYQLETVFGKIQNYLLNNDFDWFYPNEMLLYAHRSSVDPNSYYILEAEYENNEQFSLSIKVQGSDEHLTEFYHNIEQVISQIVI